MFFILFSLPTMLARQRRLYLPCRRRLQADDVRICLAENGGRAATLVFALPTTLAKQRRLHPSCHKRRQAYDACMLFNFRANIQKNMVTVEDDHISTQVLVHYY
jgi:hypothetical protein